MIEQAHYPEDWFAQLNEEQRGELFHRLKTYDQIAEALRTIRAICSSDSTSTKGPPEQDIRAIKLIAESGLEAAKRGGGDE